MFTKDRSIHFWLKTDKQCGNIFRGHSQHSSVTCDGVCILALKCLYKKETVVKYVNKNSTADSFKILKNDF